MPIKLTGPNAYYPSVEWAELHWYKIRCNIITKRAAQELDILLKDVRQSIRSTVEGVKAVRKED